MAARARSLFSTVVLPFDDQWIAGPGLTSSVVRFGVWVGLPLANVTDPATQQTHATELALIAPEVSYSVLPYTTRQTHGVALNLLSREQWRDRPVPRWRGIPCELGQVEIRLRSDQTTEWSTFPVLFLLPERAPSGPPELPVLGCEFLLHYGWQLRVDYRQIQFEEPGTPSRRIDSSAPCGHLAIS
jgi:hypothetical protein